MEVVFKSGLAGGDRHLLAEGGVFEQFFHGGGEGLGVVGGNEEAVLAVFDKRFLTEGLSGDDWQAGGESFKGGKRLVFDD